MPWSNTKGHGRVEVEYGGRTHRADFQVVGDIIHVSTGSRQPVETQLGNSGPEQLAATVALEILHKNSIE